MTKKKKPARKHHFITQAYLAAFTDTGSKDGQLYVMDVDTGQCFRTSPENVAAQRDFNRVDIEGKPSDILEQALSPMEQRMVEACHNVNCTQTFPNDEDYNYILNLLCLFAVRNPKLRRSFNRAREMSIKIIFDMLVSDPKIYEHYLKRAKEAGDVEEENNVSFEDMKRAIEEDDYKIEFHPEGNLRVEFHTFDKVLPMLGQRSWSLLKAPDPGPYFICSDHPVTLSGKNQIVRRQPIGYGVKNTEVFFPLGPRTAFYGVYEDFLPAVVAIEPARVTMMNRRVADNAERHVFASTDKFYIWVDGKILEVNCGSNIWQAK